MSADPQARESIAIRILWMLLFVLVWQVAELLLGAVVVIQLVYRLIYGAPNGSLMAFGDSLSQYLAQIGRFGTFHSDEKPWPFADWPSARAAEARPPTACRPPRTRRATKSRSCETLAVAPRRGRTARQPGFRAAPDRPWTQGGAAERRAAGRVAAGRDSRQPLRARPADRRAGARGTGPGRAGRHRALVDPDDDPREVLGFLDERSERNLLLVSHQPLVGALGGLLVHGNRRDPLPMSTASLAELEGDFAAAGLMTLVSLHHPRHG